jgi:acetyl-CoA acyltransferase
VVAGPLTLLMCSPLSDGAACLVLTSNTHERAHSGGARIAASVLTSGRGDDASKLSAVERAASQARDMAGIVPTEVDVVELHDATALAELHLYEQLGLCDAGEAGRLVRDRRTWLGGDQPVNPSGATGAAQIVELTWQIEGRCGDRQVPDAKLALAQNAGGWVGNDAAACAVHVLQR